MSLEECRDHPPRARNELCHSSGDTCVNGLAGIDGADDNGELVCCPLGCGACGGIGCGSFPGGNTQCCANGILNNQQDCSVSGAAPCSITGGGLFSSRHAHNGAFLF